MATIIKGECGHDMEVSEADFGGFVQCPVCGMATTAIVDAGANSPQVEARAVKEPTAGDFVRQMRKGSCYRALRIVIRTAFMLVYAFEFLMLASLLAGGLVGVRNPIYTPSVVAGTVGFLAALVAITIAAHQAMLLLIDIADASVHTAFRQS